MILKRADNKDHLISELEALLAIPNLPDAKKGQLDRELKFVRAGIKGERQAAYDIDFYSGAHNNRIVIHDLRLEFGGRVAQIDHLIINRLLEIYVLETKHFSEGVSINEQGEFTTWYAGKPRGIPSPLEQNQRHIAVLKDVIGLLRLPTRLGFRLQPSFESLVVVSNSARISRPARFDTSRVVKSDQLESWIERSIEKKSALQIAKIVSVNTLCDLVEQLLAEHRPQVFDYKARFGIDVPAVTECALANGESQTEPSEASVADPAPVEDKAPAPAPQGGDVADEQPDRPGYFCAACKATVSAKVAKFCWGNTARFGGKVYCYDCQKTVRKPVPV